MDPRRLVEKLLVDQAPAPPLTALGLPEFAAFEHMQADGITFRDTFFVTRVPALLRPFNRG